MNKFPLVAQNADKCAQRCRQFQFQEIMEGVYKTGKIGFFGFNEGYVQAAFISIENESGEGKISKNQLLMNFFKENIFPIFYYRDYYILLFENKSEPAVTNLLENLYVYLMKSVNWCAITLGNRYLAKNTPPYTALRKSCKEAEKLMEDIFFHYDKNILTFYSITKRNKKRYFDIDEEAKNLCSYIQIIDSKKIKMFFQNLKDCLLNSCKSPREIRRDCLILMIEVRNEMIRKFPALKEKPETGGEMLDGIMSKRYLESVIENMTSASLRISEALPRLSAAFSFKRIISYVNNNYYEDLRLETLARLFNYNCAYLGKCFKKNTGQNFHTYLDTLRIDTAKEMLQNTGMKVYEISSAVGYVNTDYFYSKFKKYTGKSPLLFRKNEAVSKFQVKIV